ncbi:MAG: beta-lactamase family protein [Clostridia bacterium]|nr:beta-lactamase family protein [Clostridia bacterium]
MISSEKGSQKDFLSNVKTFLADFFDKIKFPPSVPVMTVGGVLLAMSILAVVLFSCSTCVSEDAPIAPSASGSAVSSSDAVSASDPVEWSGWTRTTVRFATPVFSECDENSPVIGSLSSGDETILIRTGGELSQVRLGLDTGWIFTSALSPDTALTDPLVTVPTDGSAYDITDTKYGQELTALCQKHGGRGIQIAIIENGRVAYTFQYGYANTASRRPVTADTKYRVASISKVVLGISAMSMCDLGYIDLDTDVSEYLGKLTRNPRYEDTPITLRHFLTHTSSMSNTLDHKNLMHVLHLYKSYTYNKPGDSGSYSYSNVGYRMAGTIIELGSDMTIAKFMKSYFAPLGMNASYNVRQIEGDDFGLLYSSPSVTENPLERKVYYSSTPGDIKNYQHFAGSYVSSAKDFAKLLSILVNDGSYNGVYYMSPERVKEMETVYCSKSGFDQCITLRRKTDIYGGREIYYHTGNSSGMLALASYVDDEKSGVVVLTSGAPQKLDENGLYKCCSRLTEYCYTQIIGSGLYEEVYS